MSFDPDKHHRRSIRLRGYDYALVGAYFVTVGLQGRGCLLGEITDEELRLNDAGRMVEQWWAELASKFPSMETDEYVVMPNHFHGIVLLGARYPSANALLSRAGHPHRGAPTSGPTLGAIMDWFKTMTTNAYIRGVKQQDWAPFQGRLWQRDYYEHIVRNDNDLDRIRRYIAGNPSRWASDPENPLIEATPR